MKDNTLESKIVQLFNKKQFSLESDGDLLLDVLSRKEHQEHLNGVNEFRARLYTPLKTLHTYLHQVLSADKSGRNALSGVNVGRFLLGQSQVGLNTGSYVRAKKRLPEESIYGLVKCIGASTSKKTPRCWRVHGRHVKVFDGSTLTVRDTQANQRSYPKHSNKKLNIGSPQIRLLTVFSLLTGSVIDYALAPTRGKGTGEVTLLRSRLDCINKGDITLGDALFCHFFLAHDLMKKGADILVPGHVQRCYDFNEGIILGEEDHITTWIKPRRPKWMSKEVYAQYPRMIPIREFKKNGIVYMTTLSDASLYPKDELHQLYKRRWDAELNLRSIKTHLAMDSLASENPDEVRKEIGIHLLAYNIIRELMTVGALKANTLPTQISFKGTLQLLLQFNPHFISIQKDKKDALYSHLIHLIAHNKVGLRPGRVEPRAVKHKIQSYPILHQHRKHAIEQLRQQKNEWMDNNGAA